MINLTRKVGVMRFLLRHLLASPLYRAASEPMPMSSSDMMKSSRELLPTQYPAGELAPYLGEAIDELRHGIDVLLNVGPNGCMVSSMAEVMTPSIMQATESSSGRIQNLFSADGDVNEEQLTLAILTAMGPVRYYQASR
jgi:predicted nucleotide-binding protein (sugar kinase/HSP70/actin superfamily)